MTARVLNPVMLTEFCKMRSPVRTQMPNRTALAKIKRDLFGPVDKDDSKRFVETELTKHHKLASDRWGFNFVHGHPLADHKQYIWERVPPTTAVPQMYTLSRAAHVRPAESSTPSSRSALASSCSMSVRLQPSLDDLLDERAERSNRINESLDHSNTTSDESDTSLGSPTKAHISLVITATASPIMQTRLASQQRQSQQQTEQPQLRSSPREKRQPRITDYLKERKRLAPTPKKASPSKRTRLSGNVSRVA